MYTYPSWQKILLKQLTLEQVIAELQIAKIKTRGGFDFLAGLLNIESHLQPKYLVCNAEEGEPGTFKDREILETQPKQVIEGMMITAFITGANIGYIYLKWEFKEIFNAIEKILKEAYLKGLLGEKLLASEKSLDLYALHGAGGYICGEASAMLESIEGKKAFPRIKPPPAKPIGLFGAPAIVINVETLATISKVLEQGGSSYAKPNKAGYFGSKMFSVSGHVNKPGNYEVPLGTKFSELLDLAGGMKNARILKAVLPGGLSSPILPAKIINDLVLDYPQLQQVGSSLGSGGIIIMDHTTCMVEVLARIARFYMEESCGQCSPCREGTNWIHKIMHKFMLGKARLKDLEVLEHVAEIINKKNICALGDLAAQSVKSFMQHFREEFLKKLDPTGN